MTRWKVAFDNWTVEAETPAAAIDACARDMGLELGHHVFVVPADADGLEVFCIGPFPVLVEPTS